jgi:hypothetical protein
MEKQAEKMTDKPVVRIPEETEYVVAPCGDLFAVFQGELLPLDPEEDKVAYLEYEELVERLEGEKKQEITNPVTARTEGAQSVPELRSSHP